LVGLFAVALPVAIISAVGMRVLDIRPIEISRRGFAAAIVGSGIVGFVFGAVALHGQGP
jgi:hypothetical protein